MRMVVGPPADTNWASPWHDILHVWNNRVQILSDHAGLQPWSVTCIEAVWKFASYVAILPPERWTRRILAWNMRGPRKRGRPAYTWETALQMYSIWKGFDNWIMEAAARERWMLMKRDFVVFTLHNRWSADFNFFFFFSLRPFFSQKVSRGWLFYWAVSRQRHFYTGGSCMKGWAKSKPQLLRGGLGDGW